VSKNLTLNTVYWERHRLRGPHKTRQLTSRARFTRRRWRRVLQRQKLGLNSSSANTSIIACWERIASPEHFLRSTM